MDSRLLDIIVCPLCKGSLKLEKSLPGKPSDADAELVCKRDRLAFPVKEDIPVMLVDQARELDSEEIDS
jgi:uncharacterized protein YbaR (Trm112 family)